MRRLQNRGVAVPRWALIVPLLAIALLVATLLAPPSTLLLVLCAAALIGAVQAAVYHAEVVAHRTGEPFGTLVLAVAVTVIEVALIVSVMLTGGSDTLALARDTIFSAVMIICNGVVGLCLVVGGLRHHEQSFRIEGATTGLAALVAMAALTLVLPSFTATPGPTYTLPQLAFASVASLALWAVFVFVQTVRHRDYFLPGGEVSNEEVHAAPRYRGTHGQRPTHPDNAAFFLAAGAGVRRGAELGPIVSRDVAPTLAHLLGLTMDNVEGRRLDEALS